MEDGNNTNRSQDDQPQRFFRPVRRKSSLHVPTLGEVTLQAAMLGDLRDVAGAVDELPEAQHDERFTNELLARMVVTPEMPVEVVANLRDDAITPLIDSAVELLDIRDEFVELPDTLIPRIRLAKALREHQYRLVKPVLDSVNASLSPLEGMRLDVVDQAMKSLGADAAARNKALLDALDPTRKVFKALNQSAVQQALATFRNAQLIAEASGASVRQLLQETDRFIGLASNITRLAEQTRLVPKLTDDFFRIRLPEPLLSDALLVSGLDSRRSHTPTYQMPAVVPLDSPEQVEQRAEQALVQRLSGAYDTLAVLELRLRRYVAWRLEQNAGPKWWKQRVPGDIRQLCDDRKAEHERQPDSVALEPIHYTHLGELQKVICQKNNWREAFQDDFNNDLNAINTMFSFVAALRNDIAHPRDFSDIEYKHFRFGAEWLLYAIDRALSAD